MPRISNTPGVWEGKYGPARYTVSGKKPGGGCFAGAMYTKDQTCKKLEHSGKQWVGKPNTIVQGNPRNGLK